MFYTRRRKIRINHPNQVNSTEKSSSRFRVQFSRKRITSLIPWALPFVSLIIVCGLYWSSFFSIMHINCSINQASCDQALTQELSTFRQENLFFLEVTSLKYKLQQLYPDATAINITKTLPHTLSVSLETSNPFAIIQAEKDGLGILVTENFTATQVVTPDNQNVPVIIDQNATQIRLNYPITDMTQLFTLNLIQVLRSEVVAHGSMYIKDSENIEVSLPQGKSAIFTSLKSATKQVNNLVQILQKLELDETTIHIDVRFDQPVLKS